MREAERADDPRGSADSINLLLGAANVAINLEILSVVREQLGIAREQKLVLRQSQELKRLEIELKKVQMANDLHFYQAALDKLDEIMRRL